MDEREAFEVAGLDRYQLQQELLELKLRGSEPEGFLRSGQGVRAIAGRHRRQRPFCPGPPGC